MTSAMRSHPKSKLLPACGAISRLRHALSRAAQCLSVPAKPNHCRYSAAMAVSLHAIVSSHDKVCLDINRVEDRPMQFLQQSENI
jgi:hypothetical protein